MKQQNYSTSCSQLYVFFLNYSSYLASMQLSLLQQDPLCAALLPWSLPRVRANEQALL